MSENLGARLRRQREEQNIALAAIAGQTKIKKSLLEALERDDVSHWPSGIFRRAYIRAYAQAIGLSPDETVREFLEVYPDPEEDLATAAAVASASSGSTSGSPPTRLRHIVDSAIASLSRLRRPPGQRGAVVETPSRATEAPEEISTPRPVPEAVRVEPAAFDFNVQTPAHAATETSNDGDTQAADEPLRNEATTPAPDLAAVAQLCTDLGRAGNADEVQSLLGEVARVLDVQGLIVWIWNEPAGELRPALAHGYADKVLAHLPGVTSDADNATAFAFRSGQTCAVAATENASGALALPLRTPSGCAGVLAIELDGDREDLSAARAAATIFAALLAQLLGGPPAERPAEGEFFRTPAGNVTTARRLNVRAEHGRARMRSTSDPVRATAGDRARPGAR